MNELCIEAHEVVKRYGDYCALSGASLNVPRGKVYGLLGPNGAGKSTFIRILNKITAPDEGTIRMFGKSLQEVDLGRIGYLPEERGLYKKMKVGEQLLFLAQLKGLASPEARKRIDSWLERFEIAAWKGKKVEELSKGMQQKIQFISTVIHQPDLLIFDEPFSGFDPVNANLLRDEILRLKEQGTTVILSTHNMGSVEALCEEISLINKSHVVLQGRVNDIRRNFCTNRFLLRYYAEAPLTSLPDGVNVISHKKENELIALIVEKSDDIPTQALIERFNSWCQLFSFEELLPTMEEVFISTVTSINKQ